MTNFQFGGVTQIDIKNIKNDRTQAKGQSYKCPLHLVCVANKSVAAEVVCDLCYFNIQNNPLLNIIQN